MNLTIYTKSFVGYYATTLNPNDINATWASYDIVGEGDVNTGNWLGWIHLYQQSDWVHLYSIQQNAFLPEARASNPYGAWLYIKK